MPLRALQHATRAPASTGARAAWGLLAILLVAVVLRLPTFATELLSDDEAIYSVMADAMRRGDELFRDVVDHKPPGIYYLFLAGFQLFGPYATHGAHLFVLLAVLATTALLWRLGPRLTEPTATTLDSSRSGEARAGGTAALLWAVFSTTWHDYDALGVNCELFLVVPQALALLWLLRGPGLLGHLGVGLLVGAAVLLKYQAATFLAVPGVLLLLDVWTGRRRTLPALGALVLCVVGAALPLGGYALVAHGAGTFDAVWFWFAYNFRYISEGVSGLEALALGARRLGMIGAIALVAYGFGTAGAVGALGDGWRAVRARAAGDGVRARVAALAWLGSGTLALGVGGRFFGHYFHLVLPALCLLAARPLLRFWDQRPRWRPLVVAAVIAPALTFLLLSSVLRSWILEVDEPQRPYAEVAARIAARTAAEDPIFVWGAAPHLYQLARRPLGARFLFCQFLTGVSPGTRTATGEVDAAPSVVREAWDMLFADLEARRPRLFVDTAPADWDHYGQFPIARYPALQRYVAAHYRPVETVAGVHLYERLP